LRLHQRLLRTRLVQAALGRLIAGWLRLVAATGRWETRRGDIPARFWDEGQPFIGAHWHGRLLMMPFAWRRGAPVAMLISSHPDGRLAAAAARQLGFATIAGSTRRGGTAALRDLLRSLERGTSVAVTPDGPRGPRMRAGGAIIDLARLSGAPIVPAAFGVSRRWVWPSWDRLIVALPFGRGVFVWGEPLTIPRDADACAVEAARHELEARLNALAAEADGLVGQPAIEPAPGAGDPVTA
jgi:hypothetical protein